MGFFDTIGDAFTSAYDSTIGKVVHGVEDAGNWVGGAVSTAGNWLGGDATKGYNTISTVVERIASKADRLSDVGIDGIAGGVKAITGIGNVLTNPFLIIGGLIVVSIVLPKILDKR